MQESKVNLFLHLISKSTSFYSVYTVCKCNTFTSHPVTCMSTQVHRGKDFFFIKTGTNPSRPWSQPLMTCPVPRVKVNGWFLGMLLSNSVPSSSFPCRQTHSYWLNTLSFVQMCTFLDLHYIGMTFIEWALDGNRYIAFHSMSKRWSILLITHSVVHVQHIPFTGLDGAVVYSFLDANLELLFVATTNCRGQGQQSDHKQQTQPHIWGTRERLNERQSMHTSHRSRSSFSLVPS